MSGAAADPLGLARALIRARSVTPADDGAQAVLAAALEWLGFRVERLRFGAIENLYARLGEGAPHLCFAGHTDVVPAGDGWRRDPFGAEVVDGVLYGRGACDMKGAIAAFVAAVAARLETGRLETGRLETGRLETGAPAGGRAGSVSLLITGDEEGDAVDGTVRVLEWMRERGEVPDFCLVGEPTNPGRLGEVIKIGRRGSLSARITVQGVQGHVAYPQRADNPCHRLVAALAELTARPIDAGTEHFEPTSLQVTSIDVGNAAGNVIPAQASARLNIRFNDRHSGASLEAWLREVVGRHAPRHEMTVTVSGESFLTAPGPAVAKLAAAVEVATGVVPRLDTGGGTSDARFITRLCPVAEFGLVGRTMHQVDECVPVAELRQLSAVYGAVIGAFLG